MIFVLADGRRVAPVVMGRFPSDVSPEEKPTCEAKGWELSDNRDLFGKRLLVTFSLRDVESIEGSYVFPPIN